ncbi:hypothetical protein ANCDUO_02282 [Ancylostoma duodenale]|uniref:G-protein coupled receptors family 1 profile domain-containing protein n=1 Tax=Ancylostoma duodenale TaxID=51022 RepID=A0A0C2HCX6_9BILA|nr:hypothetical protein ANCDUO_02282 [Ancylostoma duodenale]
MCIAVIVILVYGIAHVKCRQLTIRDPNSPSIEKLKRLLCSLSLVVAVYTSTWFITFAGLVITEFITSSVQGIQT